jgi:hypothetical protein
MPWTDRLDAYAARDPESGCLIWQRALNSRGYGVLWADGRLQLAHRLAWIRTHGEPTPGLVIDHLCNRKACIEITHLQQLSNSQNLRRAVPRGDAATERRRARWRRANATRRGTYTYVDGGE